MKFKIAHANRSPHTAKTFNTLEDLLAWIEEIGFDVIVKKVKTKTAEFWLLKIYDDYVE